MRWGNKVAMSRVAGQRKTAIAREKKIQASKITYPVEVGGKN